MFKWIKRLFGLDYNDTAAEKHSGIGYMGVPNLAEREVVRPAVEGKGEILVPTTGVTRPAVDKEAVAVKKAPKKKAAKKAPKK